MMIPCAEKLSLLIACPDASVRDWLVLAAVEAECFGLMVTTPHAPVVMNLLMRQAFHPQATPRFDVMVTDLALPGLNGVGMLRQMKQEIALRPFLARIIQTEDDVADAVFEGGFDLFAPMPNSLESLTDLFRNISKRCLAWYEGVAAA
jgi:DNA-binding NarL/FixJ family response regulator